VSVHFIVARVLSVHMPSHSWPKASPLAHLTVDLWRPAGIAVEVARLTRDLGLLAMTLQQSGGRLAITSEDETQE
jgi:hypothetical protein